jgi:hypothetical protein
MGMVEVCGGLVRPFVILYLSMTLLANTPLLNVLAPVLVSYLNKYLTSRRYDAYGEGQARAPRYRYLDTSTAKRPG